MFPFVDLNHLFLPSPLADFLWKTKHPEEKRLVAFNKSLKDKYNGKRCFIVANGPSLANENLGLLANEVVFTCNLFPNSKLFEPINPTFHAITDPLFFQQNNTSIENTLEKLYQKKLNALFFSPSAAEFVVQNKISNYFSVYYVSQFFLKGLKSEINLTTCIPAFPTVVQAEICIAIYMGFKKIYLLGCDCTGFVSLAKVREKTKASLEKIYAFELNREDEKLVKNNLSVRPIENELRGYAAIFENYINLNTYCQKHNISLINLSSGGILTYLPEDKLESVI